MRSAKYLTILSMDFFFSSMMAQAFSKMTVPGHRVQIVKKWFKQRESSFSHMGPDLDLDWDFLGYAGEGFALWSWSPSSLQDFEEKLMKNEHWTEIYLVTLQKLNETMTQGIGVVVKPEENRGVWRFLWVATFLGGGRQCVSQVWKGEYSSVNCAFNVMKLTSMINCTTCPFQLSYSL